MKSSKKYFDANEKYGPQHPILHNYKHDAFEYSGEKQKKAAAAETPLVIKVGGTLKVKMKNWDKQYIGTVLAINNDGTFDIKFDERGQIVNNIEKKWIIGWENATVEYSKPACGSGYSIYSGYKNSRPCEENWQDGEEKLLMYKRYKTAYDELCNFKKKLTELWTVVLDYYPYKRTNDELSKKYKDYKLEFVKLYNLGTNASLLSLEKNASTSSFNEKEYEEKVKKLGGTFLELKMISIIKNKDSDQETEEGIQKLNERLKKNYIGTAVMMELSKLVERGRGTGDGQNFTIEDYFENNKIDEMIKDYETKMEKAKDDWDKIYKNWMDNYYAPVDCKYCLQSYHYQPMFMSYQFPKSSPWKQKNFEQYMVTRIHHKNEDFVYDIRWVRSGRRIPSRDHIENQNSSVDLEKLSLDVIDVKDEYEKKVEAGILSEATSSYDAYREKYKLTLKENLDKEKNVKVWEEGLLDKYKQLGISEWSPQLLTEVHTLTLPAPRWKQRVGTKQLVDGGVIKQTFRDFVVDKNDEQGVQNYHISND